MFGTLKKVLTNDWLTTNEYHYIKVSSLSYNYIFEVFSVYTIPVENYYITTYFSQSEYQTFLDTIINRSVQDFGVNVTENDKIIPLSNLYWRWH